MARPFKQGLEYFPLDVRIFSDEKIRDLNYSVGPLGEHIFIRILILIYQNGYYLETTVEKLAKILHKEMGPQWIKLERISMLIHACLEAGLFDKELAGQGVITSIAVQKQFLISTQRRKNVDTTKYWLLDKPTMKSIEGFLSTSKLSEKKSDLVDSVNNNTINVSSNAQKKKENKIDKKINKDKRVYGEPKLHFITNALIKNKYIDEDDLNIIGYNNLAEELISEYGFDLVLSVTDYIIKCSKKPHIQIDDHFEYFKTSAENNARMLAKRNEGGFNIGKELERLIKELGKKNQKL